MLQFNPTKAKPAGAEGVEVEVRAAPSVDAGIPAPEAGGLSEGSQNLLKHIPGEASGFYLMAADSMPEHNAGILAIIFVLALVLLVVVRWLAGASRWVMGTTIVAFIIWMMVFDNGIINAIFPGLIPDPAGLILAVFYSTLVTLLANAGKIR